MDEKIIYCAGCRASARYACTYLASAGFTLTDELSPNVTHLLMDVPSFNVDGDLQDGSSIDDLLSGVKPNAVVCGGNLKHPSLAGYRTIDLLQDPCYLAENAHITAECALEIGLSKSTAVLRRNSVLIIGWGRIGKCLAALLKALDAEVTVAARKETDRAMITALGYRAIDTGSIPERLDSYRLIYNTAPEMILPRSVAKNMHPDCIKIDLASKPGMDGEGIIWARGLPGIHRPESSGKLIADTLIRLLSKEGTL